MADKKIEILKAVRDEANVATPVSLSASDKVMVAWDAKDERAMLHFKGGSSEAKVTIKAGNGVQGCNDIEIIVPASAEVYVPINSGGFKNTYGEDVGFVVLATSAACSLTVVEGL